MARIIILFFLPITLIAYDYDLIIIGNGFSALQAAKAAIQYGKKIALVDQSPLRLSQPSCLSSACLFRRSPQELSGLASCVGHASNDKDQVSHHVVVQLLSHVGAIGYQARDLCLTNTFDPQYAFAYLQLALPALQKQQRAFFDDHAIQRMHGIARFVDNHTIILNDRALTATAFIIATEKEKKALPDIEGIEAVHCLREEELYVGNVLPESLIIVGCDEQSVMLASVLSNLGVRVILLVKYGLFLPGFDYEMVEYLSEYLTKIGVAVCVDTYIESVAEYNGELVVHCTDRHGAALTHRAAGLFIARGSTPRIADLNLDQVGVMYTKEGIIVDDTGKTSIDTIYACGEAISVASMGIDFLKYQAAVATYNACASSWTKKLYCPLKQAVRMVYATVPLASVGLAEQDAIKRYGLSIAIYRVPYRSIEQSHIDNATIGMAKFICDASGILVGTHIFGAHAEHLIRDVSIGKRFQEQGDFYRSHVYTGYKELLWLAVQQSRKNEYADSSFWSMLRHFINNYFSLQ